LKPVSLAFPPFSGYCHPKASNKKSRKVSGTSLLSKFVSRSNYSKFLIRFYPPCGGLGSTDKVEQILANQFQLSKSFCSASLSCRVATNELTEISIPRVYVNTPLQRNFSFPHASSALAASPSISIRCEQLTDSIEHDLRPVIRVPCLENFRAPRIFQDSLPCPQSRGSASLCRGTIHRALFLLCHPVLSSRAEARAVCEPQSRDQGYA